MKPGRGSRFIRSCAVLAVVSLLPHCGPTTSRKGIVAYDFVESFPLSESQHEVTFIDFGTPTARQYMRSGWSTGEGSPSTATFVWSLGRESVLEFFLHEAREVPVTFRCFPFQFPGSPQQAISIAVNGVDLQTVRLQEGWNLYRIVLPAAALKAGLNQLEFRYAYSRAAIAVVPDSVGQRILSVGWVHLAFAAGDEPPAPKARPNVESEQLHIPFGAKVDYYLRLPGKSELTFDQLILDEPGQLEVLFERKEDGELVLGKFQQSAGLSTLAVSGRSDEIVRLSFRARAARTSSSADGRATLVRPVLYTAQPVPVGPRETPADPSGEEEHSKRPNIIMYLVDTVRGDHLGCYGYTRPISPNIDALAGDGILFETAVAQAPYTWASVASLMTGLGVPTHRITRLKDSLPGEAITLAEFLGATGYNSTAIITSPALRQAGVDQGFVGIEFMRDVDAPQRIRQWLADKSDEQPFFLYVHTGEPHDPYDAPDRFRRRFAGALRQPDLTPEQEALLRDISTKREGKPSPSATKPGSRAWLDALLAEELAATQERIYDMVSLYDAGVAQADERFGLLIEELKKRKLYEDALIVFLSDHGEELYDHGSWAHGKTLYSEVLNIPLIVKLPSSTGVKGERRRDLAQHIDVVPTILDYLGIEMPKHLEGISLLPSVFREQESHQSRRIFSYVADGTEAGASVIDFPWKFIWNSVSGPNEQLFNIETDPREKTNLSGEHPLRAKYLKAMIKAHALAPSTALEPGEAILDEDLLRKLKSMGYVQ